MALNAAMSTAVRSLEVFQTGIEVAGQNIANANTPGYVREEIRIQSNADYRKGNLVHGTGSNVTGIRLAIQTQLEYRIHAANSDVAGAEIRQDAYLNLEAVLAELGSGDLSSKTNELLSALNEYTNEPTLPGLRELVLSEGEDLASSIAYTRDQVDELRRNINLQIEATISEANTLIERIEQLNVQITRTEAASTLHSDAGGLRSERLVALDRLSEIVEIRAKETSTGRIDVTSGGEYLIVDQATQGFSTYVPDEHEGTVFGFGVEFSGTGFNRLGSDGELSALLSARDDILGGFTDQLDDYASAFLFEFNRIHSQGSGTSGFTSIVSEHAVDDSTAVLNDLENSGLDFAPEHGSFNVVLEDSNTGQQKTSSIQIDLDGIGGDDTTLDDLAASLNAVNNLNATVNTDGFLEVATDAGYELKFDGDTSGVLAALGINTFFTGIDAETIAVNDVVRNDSTKFAGSRGGGPGDASNAVEMIQLFETPLDQFGGRSLDDQYQSIVYSVTQASSNQKSEYEGFQLFHDSLVSQREQYSGVSIDEETVRLMQFQHSYQAAARVLTTVNELMQILVNL